MAGILLYDIETAPIVGTVWGKYEQNLIWTIKEWHLLCFAYKWLDEPETHIVALPDFKRYRRNKTDDKELVKILWDLFDEADVIIAHNGNSFDQKKSQARMAYHGLLPPAPYKQIDTKLVARRYFAFTSNKLDDLGEHLGLGRKLETGGAGLWRGCLAGDKEAWQKMTEYNKQDVILLEKVYLKLRPWITNHPPRGIMDGRPASCDNCGSTRLHNHTKKTYSKVGWKRQYKCYDCGSYQMGTVLHRIGTKQERLA